jgi:hypothetical protein
MVGHRDNQDPTTAEALLPIGKPNFGWLHKDCHLPANAGTRSRTRINVRNAPSCLMTLRIFQWLLVAPKEPNHRLLSFANNELLAQKRLPNPRQFPNKKSPPNLVSMQQIAPQ